MFTLLRFFIDYWKIKDFLIYFYKIIENACKLNVEKVEVDFEKLYL